ncbi:MAG: hypothetical protein GXN98_03550 [Euryarchaeota archaeon]|nr:hypothetical protein [Euryarchaeota archaeon]
MTFNRVLRGVFGFVAMVLVAGVALGYATPQYAQETGENCVVCHPNGPPELGPAGEYFKEKGTLEGYGEIPEKEGEAGGRCTVCHAQLVPNPNPRDLSGAPAEPNHRFELKHGGGRFWCLTCHSAVNRDMLKLSNGTQIPFSSAPQLCGQCHGTIYRDWEERIHGRWVGEIDSPRPGAICTDCHNPHDPEFKPIEPEKPPEKPPESKKIPYYPIMTLIVLAISLALAVYAAWR